MTAALKVFLSYAHEDEAARADLGKYLRPLVRKGLIETWHDRRITGGTEWKGAIDAALQGADIILLLVSAEFLDSDYCNDVELAEATRMHEARRARVIPVILRTCPWRESPLARFNALPPDGEPILEAEHPARLYTAVAEGIIAVIGELRGSVAETASGIGHEGGDRKVGGSKPAQKQRRKIPVGKINLGIVEIGPFELAWPPRLGVSSALVVLTTLAFVAGAIYFVALRGPLAKGQDAMRIARYDLAGQALSQVPSALSWWPNVRSLNRKAKLGLELQQFPRDSERLGKDLDDLLRLFPNDADLLVFQAVEHYNNMASTKNDEVRSQEFDKVLERTLAATKADSRNAEAWYLRGLAHWLIGDAAESLDDNRKAAELGPRSPQYRTNYARALLDSGRVADAIREYGLVKDYSLARVEGALALWAVGDIDGATRWQHDGLEMLNKKELEYEFYNRRSWVFTTANQVVELGRVSHKLCYVQIEAAASRRLGGDTNAEFPPGTCYESLDKDIRDGIGQLVADDLCRFVDGPQPGLAEVAASLRVALHQPAACPAPAAPPDRPPATLSLLQENMTWSIN